jgi:hypothetical protein
MTINLTREHATCADRGDHVATQRHPRVECPTATANEPHTPDTVVVLTDGTVLEHGLYPNPDHHRGQPAGQPGTAHLRGRVYRAVLGPDWKVWLRVDGAYGPTGDWFHARTATGFEADR